VSQALASVLGVKGDKLNLTCCQATQGFGNLVSDLSANCPSRFCPFFPPYITLGDSLPFTLRRLVFHLSPVTSLEKWLCVPFSLSFGSRHPLTWNPHSLNPHATSSMQPPLVTQIRNDLLLLSDPIAFPCTSF
jgi:hypothetical protein